MRAPATLDRGLKSHAASRVATRCGYEAPLQMVTNMNSQERRAEEKARKAEL